MQVRNIQNEINDLEQSNQIKLLGIETLDGLLTRPVVETAIDSLKETLGEINFDEIAETVNKNLRAYRGI